MRAIRQHPDDGERHHRSDQGCAEARTHTDTILDVERRRDTCALIQIRCRHRGNVSHSSDWTIIGTDSSHPVNRASSLRFRIAYEAQSMCTCDPMSPVADYTCIGVGGTTASSVLPSQTTVAAARAASRDPHPDCRNARPVWGAMGVFSLTAPQWIPKEASNDGYVPL